MGDALFTATSAICVTGLAVQDTATYWTGFGQGVILLLIQVGGMGVVTCAVTLFALAGQKLTLRQRGTMQEAIAAPRLGGIVRLTGFILLVTAAVEALGAVLLSVHFCRELGGPKGVWYGLFHSVSAFCNAGFDLMGERARFSSLTAFPARPLVNIVIMLLIITGGIGFTTWEDIRTHRLNLRRYRMQSKLILTATPLLILLPAAYFYLFEFAALPPGERFWGSVFQSVTARTAGFNTLDLSLMSEGGQGLMILLMLIGGAPGSTAGGMKVTTLAVLLSTAVSVFRRREDTCFFGRRVEEGTVRSAAAILTLYLALFLGGGFLISRLEDLPLLPCLFETASAVGTVGLTLGLTPELGAASHVILAALMYCGRVGALTLVFAALSRRENSPARLPSEKLIVG
ncbi:potassium transporter TrkG [Oscillospiraceae bacterium 44-34]